MSLDKVRQNNVEIEQLLKNRNISDKTINLIQESKKNVLQFNAFISLPKLADKQELLEARQFTELNVTYSLLKKDLEEFESSMSRLKVFYDNYRFLPNSDKMNQFIALNLLYLFSYNKTTQFYSALELIPIEDINNQYIKFAIDLQRAAIVGNYEEIQNSKDKSPLAEFNFFLERIIETIRYEKARSAEKAYVSLKVNDALNIFKLNTRKELEQFANSQNEEEIDNGYNWKVERDFLFFNSTKPQQSRFNSENLIQTALNYANELEKII